MGFAPHGMQHAGMVQHPPPGSANVPGMQAGMMMSSGHPGMPGQQPMPMYVAHPQAQAQAQYRQTMAQAHQVPRQLGPPGAQMHPPGPNGRMTGPPPGQTQQHGQPPQQQQHPSAAQQSQQPSQAKSIGGKDDGPPAPPASAPPAPGAPGPGPGGEQRPNTATGNGGGGGGGNGGAAAPPVDGFMDFPFDGLEWMSTMDIGMDFGAMPVAEDASWMASMPDGGLTMDSLAK